MRAYDDDVSRAASITRVPGLELIPEYVDREGQERLLALVDAAPWRADLKRRVQHYGYRYDYRSLGTAGREAYLGPLPGWAAELAARLVEDTPVEREPTSDSLTETRQARAFRPTSIACPAFSGPSCCRSA